MGEELGHEEGQLQPNRMEVWHTLAGLWATHPKLRDYATTFEGDNQTVPAKTREQKAFLAALLAYAALEERTLEEAVEDLIDDDAYDASGGRLDPPRSIE